MKNFTRKLSLIVAVLSLTGCASSGPLRSLLPGSSQRCHCTRCGDGDHQHPGAVPRMLIPETPPFDPEADAIPLQAPAPPEIESDADVPDNTPVDLNQPPANDLPANDPSASTFGTQRQHVARDKAPAPVDRSPAGTTPRVVAKPDLESGSTPEVVFPEVPQAESVVQPMAAEFPTVQGSGAVPVPAPAFAAQPVPTAVNATEMSRRLFPSAQRPMTAPTLKFPPSPVNPREIHMDGTPAVQPVPPVQPATPHVPTTPLVPTTSAVPHRSEVIGGPSAALSAPFVVGPETVPRFVDASVPDIAGPVFPQETPVGSITAAGSEPDPILDQFEQELASFKAAREELRSHAGESSGRADDVTAAARSVSQPDQQLAGLAAQVQGLLQAAHAQQAQAATGPVACDSFVRPVSGETATTSGTINRGVDLEAAVAANAFSGLSDGQPEAGVDGASDLLAVGRRLFAQHDYLNAARAFEGAIHLAASPEEAMLARYLFATSLRRSERWSSAAEQYGIVARGPIQKLADMARWQLETLKVRRTR